MQWSKNGWSRLTKITVSSPVCILKLKLNFKFSLKMQNLDFLDIGKVSFFEQNLNNILQHSTPIYESILHFWTLFRYVSRKLPPVGAMIKKWLEPVDQNHFLQYSLYCDAEIKFWNFISNTICIFNTCIFVLHPQNIQKYFTAFNTDVWNNFCFSTLCRPVLRKISPIGAMIEKWLEPVDQNHCFQSSLYSEAEIKF